MNTLPCFPSYPWPGAWAKNRRQRTWGSASRCSNRWRSLWSSSGDVRYMTELTWMPGWKTISAEGGPERRLYGP